MADTSCFYLDLRLDIADGVGEPHLQGDGLASEGLHQDLHLGFLIARAGSLAFAQTATHVGHVLFVLRI